VTEFNYRYSDAKEAHVFAGLEVASRSEKEKILSTLRRNKIQTLDLTDNEMAKLHVRHLVGGRAPGAKHERLYRFEFPERPGALMKFLSTMGHDWNISLFHYRNHGANYGRVLVGIQVPPGQDRAFQRFLSELGYEYWDESQNPAYKLFLS
jgi:threonine dehydratase